MDKGPGTPPQILLPLEERVTHFRDMLLERGVRAGFGDLFLGGGVGPAPGTCPRREG